MRTLILFSVLFFSTISFAQTTGSKYTFKEVGWTIILPSDFNAIKSVANSVNIESNRANNVRPATKNLISAFKDNNYFIADISLLDNTHGNDHNEVSQRAFVESYKSLKNASMKVDSSTSTILLNGVSFKKYQLAVIENDKILYNMLTLTKFYKGYDFYINYMYFDEKTKVEIESMLRNSKFEK